MPTYSSYDELAAIQLKGLQWTVNHAYNGSPAYRAKLDQAGVKPDDIKSLDDLRRLPFTAAKDLAEGYPFPLLSVPMKDVVRIHASSGTTGKRKVLCYTEKDVNDWAHFFARCYETADLTTEDRVQICVGYGVWTAGVGFQLGCERFGALAVPAGSSRADQRIASLIPSDSGGIADTFVRAVDIAETGHAELVDDQGKALFSTELGHNLQTSDHPSFYTRRVAESLGSGTYRVSHEDGDERGHHVMAFVQLESLPLIFALGGTEQETYAPVGTLWRAFYALAAMAGVIAVAVTLTGAPRLTRPVRELSDAARRVAGGSLETPITVGSGGEIGDRKSVV